MAAIVAANRLAMERAEKEKAEQAESARQAKQMEESFAVGTSDTQHASSRVNSQVRQALAARETEREKKADFYNRMEEVRMLQQAAAQSPRANTEKVRARLRATRLSKELMGLQTSEVA